MRKAFCLVLVTIATTTLAACSQSNEDSKSTSGKVAVLRRGNLSVKKINDKQKIAAITVYAAKKYGVDWQKTLDIAKNEKINVSLDDRSYGQNYKGEGYIYNIGGDSAYYTISGDGDEQIIYFYDEDTFLGKRTIKQIVDYLNENRLYKRVTDLSSKVAIDKHDANESGIDDSGRFKRYSALPGDGGLYTVPDRMIGKWYSEDNKSARQVEFTKHSMSDGDNTYELHFQKTRPNDPNGNLVEQTKSFMAACTYEDGEFKGIILNSWVQSAEAKTIFISHTEEGYSVILEMNTDTGLENLYWKSRSLASKYANKKFIDLRNIKR